MRRALSADVLQCARVLASLPGEHRFAPDIARALGIPVRFTNSPEPAQQTPVDADDDDFRHGERAVSPEGM